MITDQRYEVKFILTEADYTDVIRWINFDTNFRKKFSQRKVNSLYFDDSQFQSVSDNLAGISDRRKTRLRWYQSNHQMDDISTPYLELKIRKGRLGYKRQFKLPTLQHRLLNLHTGNISAVIEEFLTSQHLPYGSFDARQIPLLHVSYSRNYYENPQGLRITIDNDIRFAQAIPSKKLHELRAYPYRAQVMEIKFMPEMKDHVAKLLKGLHITPKRHSKYLVGLSLFGQVTYY